MKLIITSIARNPYKNTVYVLLLLTAFIPMILITNTYFMSVNINEEFVKFRQSYASEYEAITENESLFEIQSVIKTTATTLLLTAVLLVFLCVALMPFLQYLLSLGRGYDMGVLLALGMQKIRVWLRLLIENIILMFSAFIIAGCVSLIIHKYFAFLLLAIDTATETELLAVFNPDMFRFNPQSIILAFSAAIVITLISSVLCNIIISKNTPLKLMRNYK